MSNVVLVTGVMGSGKTLKVVADLVNDIEKNETRPVEEKRTYYADITGLKIEGVLPSPDDWRTTPDHSYIIYDEAQLNPRFARKRGLSHISVQELTLARKRGHTIIFITQAPNRLHQDILDVIQEHYHLARPYGAKLATCYMWRNKAEKNPMGREAQRTVETKFLFTYPKKCYDYYDSAQVKNDGLKIKIPPKTAAFVLLPLALFAYAGYGWFNPKVQKLSNPASAKKSASATASTSAPTALASAPKTASAVSSMSSPPASTPQPPIDAYAQKIQSMPVNVINFGGKCTAYNKDGLPLELTYKDCLAYAHGKKPMMRILQNNQVSASVQPIPQTQIPATNNVAQTIASSVGGV